MAETLKKFMDKLGVGYTLHAYETFPWSYYDTDDAITANASVAMNSDADEIEFDLMFIYDEPEEGKPPVKILMRGQIIPHVGDSWKMKTLIIKGEDHKNKSHNWEANSCDIFRRCVTEIQRGQIPDFDEIFDQEFNKGEKGGQRGGRGGGKKSPNIRPEQMPGMSRGKV